MSGTIGFARPGKVRRLEIGRHQNTVTIKITLGETYDAMGVIDFVRQSVEKAQKGAIPAGVTLELASTALVSDIVITGEDD